MWPASSLIGAAGDDFTVNERGQVTILALGLCVVGFAIAGLAVDGGRFWVLRRGLQGAADAAAASGATALDVASYHSSGGVTQRLDPRLARGEATAILDARGLPSSMEISATHGVVRVRVRARLRTSFLSLVGVRTLPVVAEATARPFFGDP